MEREQLQHLRGILVESARILKQHRRLFFSLASTLILPLCFLLLAHHLVSGPLVHKIRHNEEFIEEHPGTSAAEHRQAEIAHEWASLLAFFIAYLLFVLAFSLLSTAATVYSVACIYTERPLSYTKVLGVVPTVWKRLLITFAWVFVMIAAYHGIAILTIHLTILSLVNVNMVLFIIILVLLILAFYSLHVYISCIWHLASVISVLEDSYGFFALRRSVDLIRVLVVLLTAVTLYGMLGQTVFYFACKSFHNEQIDWTALSEHLGAYMGEYVPLKSSIQMESL
ncbi:hypothetical protein GOP47_0011299 [Adiantum capillus-veneris]|uniref:Uncharacterized protein n=1 Tax=Adiantum capillus-veneris TaxID=13818 RepID=A0A9D4ZHQ6_ADICA|nr:hypothetical protein GOP47_0011299 [Adiantum capillus-veneris]